MQNTTQDLAQILLQKEGLSHSNQQKGPRWLAPHMFNWLKSYKDNNHLLTIQLKLSKPDHDSPIKQTHSCVN